MQIKCIRRIYFTVIFCGKTRASSEKLLSTIKVFLKLSNKDHVLKFCLFVFNFKFNVMLSLDIETIVKLRYKDNIVDIFTKIMKKKKN